MRFRGAFIFFLLSMLVSAPSIFAETVFDWGGSMTGKGELTGETDFDLQGQANLWLRADFTEDLGLYGRGVYTYKDSRPFFADLESLYARGRVLFGEDGGNGLLSYSAGRFRFREFSGYVLNHNMDGLSIGYEHPVFSLTGSAGYTGLTFIPSSSIVVSAKDIQVLANAPDHGYELADPKSIETIGMTFPGILLGQDVIFSAVLQQDLQTEEDQMHTEHFGIGLSGGLTPTLYQNMFFYLNLGQGPYTTAAFLAGGALSYYNEEFFYTRVRLRGVSASGDGDQEFFYGGYSGGDTSNHFIALSTAPTSGLVFSPEIGNISFGEISFSMRPFSKGNSASLERFQTSLGALIFFRNTGGAISAGGINPASSENYLGTEFDLALRFRPFSDLGISLSGGLFLPNAYNEESAFATSEDEIQSVFQLDVSLIF